MNNRPSSAPYIESVGDNKHYDWQTPTHNRLCLGVTVLTLVGIFILFYHQNKVRLDEFNVEITDSLPNLRNFEFHIDYCKRVEFNRGANYGRTSTIQDENFDNTNYDGVRMYATCEINSSAFHKQQTLGFLNAFSSPKIDERLRELDTLEDKINMEYSIEPFQKLHFDIKIKSPYFSHAIPILYHTNTKDHPERNSGICFTPSIYEIRNSMYYVRDTFCTCDDCYLHKPIRNKKGSRTYEIFDYDKKFAYFNEIYLGNVKKKWNPFVNMSICNIRINNIKFPRAEKNQFVLSFNSPMYFDIVSVKPDSVTDTQLIFNTPTAINRIQNGELYIYARSIASENIQDTLNFIYATIIGLIFSFMIEFRKRLYNQRRQAIYESGRPYRHGEAFLVPLAIYSLWDYCYKIYISYCYHKSRKTK